MEGRPEGPEDEVLIHLLSYMCTHRSLRYWENKLSAAIRDCARRGAHLIEAYIREYHSDLKGAVLALFHSKCIAYHASSAKSGGGCAMDKKLEKEVLKRWAVARAQSLFEEEGLMLLPQEDALSLMELCMREIGLLRKEITSCTQKRNDIAYVIMRRYFAASLVKCLENGKDSLGPGERLLVDYTSVNQLGLCKNTDRVFDLAVKWLYHVEKDRGKPNCCYKCQKKRASGAATQK
jgi:hypothetical protein